MNDSESIFTSVFNVKPMAFQIRYYPNERLFHVRFNNENRTQFVLYADKATDLVNSTNSLSTNIVLLLHITPTLISCYVNCELTDQEFVVDSNYLQSIIRQITDRTQYSERYEQQQQFIEYDRHSTLILANKSIEQVGANIFCLKLDKKNEDLLPDKYALR